MSGGRNRRQLTPNVDYLRECGRYMIDTEEMAGFLQIPAEALKHMVWMGRLPPPLKLGFGQEFDGTSWNYYHGWRLVAHGQQSGYKCENKSPARRQLIGVVWDSKPVGFSEK